MIRYERSIIFLISIKVQIFILPVQFIAEFSIESGRDKTDLSVDVVPQIHEFGQKEIFCFSFSSLLLTAHAKTEKSKRSLRLASFR